MGMALLLEAADSSPSWGAGDGDSPAACPAGRMELSPLPRQSRVPKRQNNQHSCWVELLQQGWQQQFLNTVQGRWWEAVGKANESQDGQVNSRYGPF